MKWYIRKNFPPVYEALRQRITVHYNYKGLSDEETVAYIVHKLCSAGSPKAIIEDAALSAIAILATNDEALSKKLEDFRTNQTDSVLKAEL